MPENPPTNFFGTLIARTLEEKLPLLEKTVGELIYALSKTTDNTWKYQARQLRESTAALGNAIQRLEKEKLDADYFTALWRALDPIAQYGRTPAKTLAKKARTQYEPIWREIVKNNSMNSRNRKEITKEKDIINILCANCKKPAIVFTPQKKYTDKTLAADEYKFLKPLVPLTMANSLVTYLKKYLPYGAAEYCPPCDAFYCANCSPTETIRIQYSDKEPVMTTCPKGHERQVDER